MHINNNEHRGFIKTYDRLISKLTTSINMLPLASSDITISNMPVKINAIWDTGATLSFIKPKIRDQLKLRMFRTGSSVTIAGVGGSVKADFSFVSIQLTNNFIIEYCPVYVVDFPLSYDMVIGMDIIGMGDFAICNTDNKTSFSFAVPPFPDRIDLVDKADKANKSKR